MVGAGVGVLALALVGAGFVRGSQIGSVKSKTKAVVQATQLTEAKIAKLKDVETLEADVAAERLLVMAAAQGDVAWSVLVQKISAGLPAGVWLNSLSGSRGSSSGAASTVTFSGTAGDQAQVAGFLNAMAGLGSLDHVWLANATRADDLTPVTFSATATMTPAAESGIAAKLGGPK
jgi:Tfp pilus assembly protein PilN